MYCTVDDMRRVLPEKITIGDTNIGTPVPGRQGSKRSNITPEEAQYYIGYAQQYIDSRLRPYYVCPLRRIVSFDSELDSSVLTGTSVNVTVRDSNNFAIGQIVRLKDKSKYKNVTITEVVDSRNFVVDTVTADYLEGTVSIVEFPDPIPLITARMACSYVLDRLFSAEQSPDVSQYGKTQRNLARNAVDDLLHGEILLFGQEHTGYRFVRGSVYNAYASPADVQRGEERE